jgi:hypothetical protein
MSDCCLTPSEHIWRNLCIIGSSLLIGLMVPRYLAENKDAIKTGMPTEEYDNVVLFVFHFTAVNYFKF